VTSLTEGTIMRKVLIAVIGAATLCAAGVAAPAGAVADACIGGPGCRTSLQAAVDAAPPGATIRIAAGTYAGGVRIAKSLQLLGAGSGRTVIRGGGPVVTIDTTSPHPPTVVISNLALTGGVAHGADGINALGGGVLVTAGPGGTIGANVTLRDVVVSGNRAAPTTTSPSPSGVKCPDGDCPYAASRGGGIASFGTLTIERSVVTHNSAAGPASDVTGGGIYTGGGSLTIRSSAVTGNRSAPERIGRFAEGGGIQATATTTTITGSSISGNSSVLVTSWPTEPQGELLDMIAVGGGIHITDGGAATIQDSTIVGNDVLADDPAGEPSGFGSGLLADDGSHVRIARTAISNNRLDVRAATSEDVGPSGGAVEIDGSGELSDVQISDNSSTVSSVSRQAWADGALADFADQPQRLVLTRVTIRGNAAVARSTTGSALVVGGGILNDALMDLSGVTIHGNTATAVAPAATAQGGGIYSGPVPDGQSTKLTVSNSRITANVAAAGGAGQAQGGGVYSLAPLSPTGTVIAGNRPDQCVGCAGKGSVPSTATTQPSLDRSPSGGTSTLVRRRSAAPR
jgi:hypothetical protein